MRGYLSDSQRKNFGTPIVREVIIKANNDARYDVSSTRYDASEALRHRAGVGVKVQVVCGVSKNRSPAISTI